MTHHRLPPSLCTNPHGRMQRVRPYHASRVSQDRPLGPFPVPVVLPGSLRHGRGGGVVRYRSSSPKPYEPPGASQPSVAGASQPPAAGACEPRVGSMLRPLSWGCSCLRRLRWGCSRLERAPSRHTLSHPTAVPLREASLRRLLPPAAGCTVCTRWPSSAPRSAPPAQAASAAEAAAPGCPLKSHGRAPVSRSP